jgi:uncharacterized membrane protein YedE/YeeE
MDIPAVHFHRRLCDGLVRQKAVDMIAPLVKTGIISETANLWLAVPTGFIFGFGLYHAGFTDSRRIARAFYLKDVGVPIVMFSAIVTGMLGLWLLSLLGVIDTSLMYYLPTYLKPMAVGGLLFGIGMAVGGFCPGTAAASVATGRVDAMIFVLGFLGGSILFGDLFPIWGNFYNSDYRGVYRLDELFGMNLGSVLLIMVIAAVAGSLAMRFGQHYFWPKPDEQGTPTRDVMKFEFPLVLLAMIVGLVLAFFPTESFIKPGAASWYIIQKQAPPSTPHSPQGKTLTPVEQPTSVEAPAPAAAGGEGC